jgi:uncharacterized membrane protein YdbT with pleckstrin-like domain
MLIVYKMGVVMRFVRKRNLIDGEEILYVPQLHWFYTIKPLVLSLPYFLVLLIMWYMEDAAAYSVSQMGFEFVQPYTMLIRQLFLAGIMVIALIFVCRIFMYLNTEYGVTNRRILLKKGVLRVTVAEIPTDRIESIYCVQGILGRIFRYGTLYVSGIGGIRPMFVMVARPYSLRRKIVEIIEKNKTITVVHGDMSKLKMPAKPEPVVEQEPIYRYGTFVRVLPNGDI